MSYRGIVKGGVVVLEPSAHLADGQAVEVVEVFDAPTAAVVDPLPGFGLWQDRTDISDSAEESLRLRRSIEVRGQ